MRVINVKTRINENLYLMYIENVLSNYYYDFFTGKKIIRVEEYGVAATEAVELLSKKILINT